MHYLKMFRRHSEAYNDTKCYSVLTEWNNMEWPILDRSSAQSSLEIINKCQDNRQTTSKMYYVHYKLKY